LMWEVDSQATQDFIESFWAAHIHDWSNLEMDRMAPLDRLMVGKGWDHVYKGGEVFFRANGLSFMVTGCDLSYAAALLTNLSGNEEPLIWAKRLAHRYVETRNPATGIACGVYTQHYVRNSDFGDDYKDHFDNPYTEPFPFLIRSGDPFFRSLLFGQISSNPGTIGNIWASPYIGELILGRILGDKGREFVQWASEEMTAWAKEA